ncbi:MAG: hypothetical protein RL885_28560 [Planctomycetota bacterium]
MLLEASLSLMFLSLPICEDDDSMQILPVYSTAAVSQTSSGHLQKDTVRFASRRRYVYSSQVSGPRAIQVSGGRAARFTLRVLTPKNEVIAEQANPAAMQFVPFEARAGDVIVIEVRNLSFRSQEIELAVHDFSALGYGPDNLSGSAQNGRLDRRRILMRGPERPGDEENGGQPDNVSGGAGPGQAQRGDVLRSSGPCTGDDLRGSAGQGQLERRRYQSNRGTTTSGPQLRRLREGGTDRGRLPKTRVR